MDEFCSLYPQKGSLYPHKVIFKFRSVANVLFKALYYYFIIWNILPKNSFEITLTIYIKCFCSCIFKILRSRN